MNLKQILKAVVKAVMTVVAIKSVSAQNEYERVWCPFTENCPPLESCEIKGEVFLKHGLGYYSGGQSSGGQSSGGQSFINDTLWRRRSGGMGTGKITPDTIYHIAGHLYESVYLLAIADGTTDYYCNYWQKRNFSVPALSHTTRNSATQIALKTTVDSYFEIPGTFITKYITSLQDKDISFDYEGFIDQPMNAHDVKSCKRIANNCDIFAKKSTKSSEFFKSAQKKEKLQAVKPSMCLVL